MTLVVAIVRFALTAMGAYTIAILLTKLLPDPGVVALGIYSGNADAVATFRSLQETAYLDLLSRAIRLDLGVSLDGVPVLSLIGDAVLRSLPQLLVAVGVLVLCHVLATLFAGERGGAWLFVRLLNTLPPYVPIFAVMAALLALGVPFASPLIAGFALAIPSLAYLLTIGQKLRMEELRAQHTRFHVSLGASELDVRTRVLRATLVTLLPSLQVILISLLASQMFVEIIANIGGLGALTVRAAKRVDVSLLLGLVLLYAAVIGATTAMAKAIRSQYPS